MILTPFPREIVLLKKRRGVRKSNGYPLKTGRGEIMPINQLVFGSKRVLVHFTCVKHFIWPTEQGLYSNILRECIIDWNDVLQVTWFGWNCLKHNIFVDLSCSFWSFPVVVVLLVVCSSRRQRAQVSPNTVNEWTVSRCCNIPLMRQVMRFIQHIHTTCYLYYIYLRTSLILQPGLFYHASRTIGWEWVTRGWGWWSA